MTDRYAVEVRFLDWLVTSGLPPVKFSPAADGRIHRFRVEGDKAGSRNGWCVLNVDPVGHGAAGSWKSGESRAWFDREARPIDAAERATLRKRMAEVKKQRAEEQDRVWAEARTKAEKLYRLSKPATVHPYLVAKGVKAWGARQLRDQLVIPARDVDGRLHTLQLIAPDGGKKFLTGGRVRGCYYAIGRPAGMLLIGEGFATCASVFEATGQATAVAFNAGNLVEVAKRLRDKFGTGIKIVVCADDDHATVGNPGLTEAFKAAACVGGWVARPDFSVVTT